MPRPRTSKRKPMTTARKFAPLQSGRRTTEFHMYSGRQQLTAGGFRFLREVQGPAGDTLEVAKLGGVKLTIRLAAMGTNQDTSMCIGVLKLNAGENGAPNGVIPPGGMTRRIFSKNTWIDEGGYAPTLVQFAVRGLITLAQGQTLWLVYAMTELLGTVSRNLNAVQEFSRRTGSIDA